MDAREDDGTTSATHLASPFSSSSTSSCSCGDGGLEDEAEVLFIEQRRPTEEMEEDDRDEDGGDHERGTDGDDDGYCTPTSPQHMIPPNKECPPAPKRKYQWFPNLKRKAEVAGGLSRSAVQPVRVLDLSLELDGFLQKSKKARREASIAK